MNQKTLREDAHLAEMKCMLCIPLGRERVASDSMLNSQEILHRFYNMWLMEFTFVCENKTNGIKKRYLEDRIESG